MPVMGTAPVADERSILCAMRIPPSPEGPGGSQRAWLIVNALARLGRVHFVLLHREGDSDLQSVSLEPLRAVVDSVTTIAIGDWDGIKHRFRWIPWRIARWIDQLWMGSGDAPRLPARALDAIASRLPGRQFDLLFAGRLPVAVIADALIRRGSLIAGHKLVDLDDVLSEFKQRELAARKGTRHEDLLLRLDSRAVRRAEARIADWDGVFVCNDHNVEDLARAFPGGRFLKLLNVIERPLLPPPSPERPTLLFVGNLSFPPNLHGIRRFLHEAWPAIRRALPDARLRIVGLRPPPELQDDAAHAGAELHADVPSVEPFYEDCSVVICPIFFGGGTRIKLLEAMAFGRAIVSTTMGAEGLGLTPDRHFIAADDMASFADAVLRLLRDPALGHRLADAARAHQQAHFNLTLFDDVLSACVTGLQDRRQ